MPSAAETPTGSTPEATAVAANSQPDVTIPAAYSGNAPTTASGSIGVPDPTAAPSNSGDSAEPTHTPETPPAESPLSPEQIKEAENIYSVAEFYLGAARYHRALQSLEQAIAIYPDFAEAYTLRGFARTALHDYDGGLEDLNRAIDLDAENTATAYAFRSYAYSELGNYDQAIDDAETAARMAGPLQRDPAKKDTGDAGLALFTAHYRSEDYGAAETTMNRYGESESNKNYGLHNILNGQRVSALAHWTRILDGMLEIDAGLLLNPSDAGLYHQRAGAHSGAGWHAQAVEDLTKALELYGNDAPGHLHFDLARENLKLGEHEKVVQALSQVDIVNHGRASYTLAYAYLRLGQNEDARRSIDAFDYDFDRLAAGDRFEFGDDAYKHDYPTHHVLKGAVYAANGDYDDGVGYLNLLGCPTRVRELLEEGQNEHPIVRVQGLAHDPSVVQDIAEWCGGYPDEISEHHDVLKSVIPVYFGDTSAYRFVELDWLGELAHARSFDPLVIESDNVPLLRYMTALYGIRNERGDSIVGAGFIDSDREIERVIELDPSIADVYRVKSELYLSAVPVRYEEAVAAWEKYESLATPEPEVAAAHYFMRGNAHNARSPKIPAPEGERCGACRMDQNWSDVP